MVSLEECYFICPLKERHPNISDKGFDDAPDGKKHRTKLISLSKACFNIGFIRRKLSVIFIGKETTTMP